MEQSWNSYIESLPGNERRSLFNAMGLQAQGFRKGAKNIPVNLVTNKLLSAFERGKGRPFIDWFTKNHQKILDALEELSDDQLVDMRSEWLKQHPPQMIRIALSLQRPELLEAWDAELSETEKDVDLMKAKEARDRLSDELDRLKREHAQTTQRLDRLQKERDQLEKERNQLQRQIQKANSMNAQLSHDLKKSQAQLTTYKYDNEKLTQDVERLKMFLGEITDLYPLYRSLSGFVPSDRIPQDPVVDRRAVVIGRKFPAHNFEFQGELLQIEGVDGSTVLDDPQSFERYDHIFLLASNPHEVRFRTYQRYASKMSDIASLDEIRQALQLKEGVS